MNNLLKNVIQVVQNSPTKVAFVSLRNYTDSKGEVQNALINVGVSYENAKKKDIEYLQNLDVKSLKTDIPLELLEKAKEELLKALIKPNENRSNGQIDAYTFISNGIKVHNVKNELYIFGMSVNKKVIEESKEEKVDTRKPLTKAKDFIRKGFKSTKYRQYNVLNLGSVKLNGETIVFE